MEAIQREALRVPTASDTVVHLDSSGSSVSEPWSANHISSRGNGNYVGISATDGSISSYMGTSFLPANAFWRNLGGDPEGQNAARLDIELVWCAGTSCSSLPSDANSGVAFSYRANDLPHTVISFSPKQISLIKQTAIKALQTAYSAYRVSVGEGGEGAHTAYVVDSGLLACGATASVSATYSRIMYDRNMADTFSSFW